MVVGVVGMSGSDREGADAWNPDAEPLFQSRLDPGHHSWALLCRQLATGAPDAMPFNRGLDDQGAARVDAAARDNPSAVVELGGLLFVGHGL